MVMAQSALATASVSNEELYGKMIAQAESIVKDAQEKGLEANEALKERQEALDKLKKEAAQNRKEVKEAMAKVRAEGRAGSAPAAPSRRLQADLDAGVHPRAAKKADKDRQRAASHRAATGRDRTASRKRFERTTRGQANPEKWDREDPGDTPELPKPRKLEPKRHRGGHLKSKRRRADEARKRENEAKMSEMSREGTPPWVHDQYPASDVESVASGEDDLVNGLDRLKLDPQVRHRLNQVLIDAYEETYNEKIELDSRQKIESDEPPLNELPPPGMEDVVQHWETSQRVLMPFKEWHEKSKTEPRQGHPYVKCQACGKALNSMSIGSFSQHVESKSCYPQSALEFWKRERRREKADKEASRKRTMEDSEALSEKKLQEIAKNEGGKRRKEHFESHYERFRHHGKDDSVKPEVKKIPKRPGEKEKDKKK